MTTYTATVEYDPLSDDYVLPLPDQLLKDLGWEIGDALTWEIQGNSIILSKSTE